MRNAALASSLVVAAIAVSDARAQDIVLVDDGLFVETFGLSDGTFKNTQAIKGLAETDRILSIDVRPSSGDLFGLTTHGLYRVDPTTGWAIPVGDPFVVPISDGSSLEFVPSAGVEPVFPSTDEALVFEPAFQAGTRAGKNATMRIDPSVGTVLTPVPSRTDPSAVVYAPGDPASGQTVHGLALGAAPTALYAVDDDRRTLVRIDPQAGGPAFATTIGDLGIPSTTYSFGLDFAADGTAYLFAMDSDGFRPTVYTVDLGTGAATPLQTLAPPRLGVDMALAPRTTLPALRPLTVSTTVVRLNFRRSGKDTVVLSGTLPPPADGWRGKSVLVSIAEGTYGTNQINRSFALNARGRSVGRSDAFVVGAKRGRADARWSLKLTRGGFHQFNRDATSSSGPLPITVDFLVDGVPYRTSTTLDYVARTGKGVATTPRR